MKFSCKSCGSGYTIPAERVASAGRGGLRVRCKQCRAIMVVDQANRDVEHREAREAEIASLPARRMAVGGGAPELTDIRGMPDPGPIPAQLSNSGVYRAIPGVRREVTGIHLKRADKKSGRVWYAAIGGTPRGPFTEKEVRFLAERGKVRGRTLVWRPGFGDWQRIRTGGQENPELDWIRHVVIVRKRSELDAQLKAKAELGIHPIMLENDGMVDPAPKTNPPPVPAEKPPSVGAFEQLERQAERARRFRIAAIAAAAVLFGFGTLWAFQKSRDARPRDAGASSSPERYGAAAAR